MTSAALIRDRIDPQSLIDDVASPSNGAIIVFLGVVREVNDGRAVTGIEYTAYETMASRELNAIAREAAAKFGSDDVCIVHRI